jgi:hypothetical protein
VPPRSTAVPSARAASEPTQRDRHLQGIAEKGRIGWQKMSGYNKRSRVEAAIGRYKQVIGDGRPSTRGRVRSRKDQRRTTRGRRLRSCPEPDAGVGTPGLRPRRMNADGVGGVATHPSIHATTPHRSGTWVIQIQIGAGCSGDAVWAPGNTLSEPPASPADGIAHPSTVVNSGLVCTPARPLSK